jgi:uncharacterized protein YbjQ (UPF0145 family)
MADDGPETDGPEADGTDVDGTDVDGTDVDGTAETADAVGAHLDRLGTGSAWGSLLSTQDFAAITSVGFRPVGHVLGAAVVHLGYASRGGRCSSIGSYTSRTDLASGTGGPFNVLLRQRSGVRHRVLSRALEECQALGGDGIIGVTLSIRPFPAGGTEFTLLGTAIAARTEIRPPVPFSSHVSAQEFARLLRSGWLPTSLVFSISLGARHIDRRTRKQTARTVTDEVRGYSELVKDTRRDARTQLAKAVAEQGADGVVVDEMTLHLSERECPAQEGMQDRVAEAAILGTTIVSFVPSQTAADRPPVTIMHLNPAPPAATGLRPDTDPDPAPPEDPEGGFLDRLSSAWAARRAARSRVSYGDPTAITKKSD